MGEEVGRALMSLHQQKGVQFCMEEEVAEFSGDSSLEAVLLKSDRRLKADLVVVGVGVTPATNITGLPTDSRGETSTHLTRIKTIKAELDLHSVPKKCHFLAWGHLRK